MHSTSALRDATLAVRRTASLALALHEGDGAAARGGKAAAARPGPLLHGNVVAELKVLDALAARAAGEVKGRIGTLRAELGGAGWLDRVLDWTFGADDDAGDEVLGAVSGVVGGRSGAEEWAGKVLESWREGVKGWANVKME